MKTKTKKKNKAGPTVTESSGNVFADLGLRNPEQELLKARLTLQIYRIIRERKMTQTEAAKVLGIKQPHVSLLASNRSGGFSVDLFTTDTKGDTIRATLPVISQVRTSLLRAFRCRQNQLIREEVPTNFAKTSVIVSMRKLPQIPRDGTIFIRALSPWNLYNL